MKYWEAHGILPNARFGLWADAHTGNYAVFVQVEKPVANPWEIQLTQGAIPLRSGIQYRVGLWAKADEEGAFASLAVIDSGTFALFGNETVELTSEWTCYEMTFVAPANATAMLNVDLGGSAGRFFFDDFALTELQ